MARRVGGIVLRKLSFLAALTWVLIPSAPASAQDQQPSLGDVARQARKDKAAKSASATPSKTVITDETLPSSGASGGSGGGGFTLGDLGDSKASASTDPVAAGYAGLDRAEVAMNKLAPMDRSTLAKVALGNNDVDFPGRREWEEKLFSAKQGYVSHARGLIREVREILTNAQALHASEGANGKVSPDDPRVKGMTSRVQEILQDAVRTDSAFQAIVMEGQDLAKQGTRR
jgi:hypothetical protein